MNSRPGRCLVTIYGLLLLGVIAFQLGLYFGAPWGELTMGGATKGALPINQRGIALISAAILAGLGIIALARSGIGPAWLVTLSKGLIWVSVVFHLLTTILNLITPSQSERLLWGPVNIAMFGLVLGLALNRRRLH